MDILGIMGEVPGAVVATLSHGREVRQISMHVARHPGGGWHVRQACGRHGPRCHSVTAAVLMEASDAFDAPPSAQPCPALSHLRLEAPLAA